MFIQSSLFGLVPALERIPYYRLSAGSLLPGVSLSKLWADAHKDVWPRLTGQILDMRSKAYVSLNPIPKDKDSFFLEVLDANSGKALNHFNKKAKGAFAKAFLETGLESSSEIPMAAKRRWLGSQSLRADSRAVRASRLLVDHLRDSGSLLVHIHRQHDHRFGKFNNSFFQGND